MSEKTENDVFKTVPPLALKPTIEDVFRQRATDALPLLDEHKDTDDA